MSAVRVYRARIFTPVADPFAGGVESSHRYFEDGHLAVSEEGRITSVGNWPDSPEGEVVDLSHKLIAPGFIDTHLHAPQLEMIGSYGGHLLEWLNRYTFPTERKFADLQHARKVAAELFEELRVNGTLTALMFSTIHTAATEAFFEEAERTGFRAIIGKTL